MFDVVANNGAKVGEVVVVRLGQSTPRVKVVAFVREGIAHIEDHAVSGMVEQPYDRGLGDVAVYGGSCNHGTILDVFGFDSSAKYGTLAPDSWCRLETYTRL